MELEYRIEVGGHKGVWMTVHDPGDLDGYDRAAIVALNVPHVKRVTLKVVDSSATFKIRYRRRSQ